MIISHELEYVFINVPKTGSRSIAHVLCEEFKGEAWGDGWLKGRHTHQHIVPKECRRYFVFGGSRNPYSRAVSGWQMYRQSNTVGFVDYLTMAQNNTLQYQEATSKPCCYFESDRSFDRVIKFENLQSDFDNLPFNFHKPSLPKIGSQKYEHWARYYNTTTENLVFHIWLSDFKRYKYPRMPLVFL